MRLVKLFLAALLMVLVFRSSAPAAGTSNNCRIARLGFGYAIALRGSEYWRYELRLKSTNSDWRHSSYGWHAQGQLECGSCRAGGLYYFAQRHDILDSQYTFPKTAAARIARAEEYVGYPRKLYGNYGLKGRVEREPLHLGPLSGYAVRFDTWAAASAGAAHLLVVSLSDDCLVFDIAMRVDADNGLPKAHGIASSPLALFLEAIVIESRPDPSFKAQSDGPSYFYQDDAIRRGGLGPP